jgi:hypothetical protein
MKAHRFYVDPRKALSSGPESVTLDRMRLQEARDRLDALGFDTALAGNSVRASQGGLDVVLELGDADRNDAVLIRPPRFAFRVHAQGDRLETLLRLLAETGGALIEGDPEPFAGLAKVSGLTWFVES